MATSAESTRLGGPVASNSSVDPERYDSYLKVHKALRALMAETLVRIGRMDPDDDDDTCAALEQVRMTIAMAQTHLHKEETVVHPAMESRAPGSTHRAANDHLAHTSTFERIILACNDVAASRGVARAAAAQCLYRRFALLMADDFVHMHAEETENNAVLWATHTDAELMQIVERLVASIPPETMAKYLRWMVTANTPQDRTKLLSSIRLGMPRAGYLALLDTILPSLSDIDQRKLADSLS